MSRQGYAKIVAAISSVVWFIPPYVSVAFIDFVGLAIGSAQGQSTQEDLEKVLAFVFGADRLASMVISRYGPGTGVQSDSDGLRRLFARRRATGSLEPPFPRGSLGTCQCGLNPSIPPRVQHGLLAGQWGRKITVPRTRSKKLNPVRQ